MRAIPIVSAFAIALIGAVAVGLRPGFPFSALLVGATLVAAMTGLAASVLQFTPERYFPAAAILTGSALGLLVPPLMDLAQSIGFGDLRGGSAVVWPVAAVVGLLFSRSWGMRLPRPRRANVGDQQRAGRPRRFIAAVSRGPGSTPRPPE